MNSSITYPKSTKIELVEHIFLEGNNLALRIPRIRVGNIMNDYVCKCLSLYLYINLYFAIWQHKQTNKQKKCTEKQSNTQELYTRKINETELHI